MSTYVKGIDKNQMSFGLLSLDDMVGGDNSVRAIDAIVDTMDISKYQFIHSTPSRTGRPPHDPVRMFKLYLYCYFEKIRSSRCIEKECSRNIEAMWLMEQIVPDHKCISEFRRQNKVAIKAAFSDFMMICDALDLLGKNLAVIDGSKFRANNARKRHVTIPKIDKKLKYFHMKLDEYLCDLDENDENHEKSDKSERVENTKRKIEELETLKKDMKEQGIGELSLTDPDARLMITANNGHEVSYNVQTAVDGEHDLIIATEVIQTPADQGQLYPMAKQAAKLFESDEENPVTVLADKGYFEGEGIKSCEECSSITAIVARPEEKGNDGYQKSKFIYDEENDHYICPQGHILYRTGNKKEMEYANRKACKECEYREQCTKSDRGRRIFRSEYEEAIEISVARLSENKELYKRRQMIVEHPFGTIKRSLGYNYFLTRGLENVKTENYLHMLTYNIKRLLNIYSVPVLIRKLEEIRMKRQGDAFVFYFMSAIFHRLLLEIGKLAARYELLAA